jgi:DNA-binding response OmpR family regulator
MEPEPNHVVILVIEDDPSVRTLLRDIFVEEDYNVLLAESGEKALVTLTTVRPDLITLDLDLPGINGATVLRQLREQQETERLPVVLVSAKERISSEVKAQAQAIVRKPFDVDDLLAVVRRLLPPLAKVALG